MSQNKVRNAGVLLLHFFIQSMLILYQNLGCITIAKVALGVLWSHTLSMSQMVITYHKYIPASHIGCKIIVTVNIFRHAMNHL